MPKTTYLIRNALGYSAEGVLLFVIKSVAESKWKKLWMISAYINKNDTVTQVSNDIENVPQSYVRNELASPVSNDNVTQNKASVNNNDTKFPLDVNFSYNELIKKPDIKKAML